MGDKVESKSKKILKGFLNFLLVLVMLGILYYIFKDNYKEIIYQVSNVDGKIFAVAVIVGNIYYFFDAYVYWSFLRNEGHRISFLRCVFTSYLSPFFNVTTFGVGIKPAQVAYLKRKGVDSGKGFGILTAPYVFSRTAIVVYALVMLIFNNKFVTKNFASSFGYIYGGIAFSVFVVILFIMICSSRWFHRLIAKVVDALFSRGKLAKYKFHERIKTQTGLLYDASCKIVRKPIVWFKYIIVNLLRMSCWYVVPILVLYAMNGSLGGVSAFEIITATALMQLIVGMIPIGSGVGSLEVVFTLLFAAIYDTVTAGSCMILYRIATYYVPFIISIVDLFVVELDMRNVGADE